MFAKEVRPFRNRALFAKLWTWYYIVHNQVGALFDSGKNNAISEFFEPIPSIDL